jgi:large repetitive protein
MWFPSWSQWLDQLVNSSARFGPGRSARPARGVTVRRPRLEILEPRLAPATRTWTGAGTDNLWMDPQNWSGNVAPVPGQDSLLFPGTAAQFTAVNNFSSGSDFLSITFSGGGYTLSGNPIQLGSQSNGTGSLTDNSGATTNTINLNIAFAGPRQGGFVGTETFSATPGTLLTIAGQISGPSSVQLQTRNTGTLVFSGDNSGYSGPITVNQGALQIESATALGSNNSTAVLAGATLQIVNVTGAIGETLIISGTGIADGGALENLSGNNTLSGSITFGANVLIAADAGQMTLGGVLQDNGVGYTVTFGNTDTSSQGTVVLTNADTYTGRTVVNNGILNIQNATALGTTTQGVTVNNGATLQLQGVSVSNKALTLTGFGVNNTGALDNVSGTDTWSGLVTLAGGSGIGAEQGSQLTVSGVIREGAAQSGLTKEGTGTLVLTNANIYTGITTVHQGILNIQNPLALGGSAALGVVVVGRATLQTEVSVSGELLTLNGPGVNDMGAIDNVLGINTWSGNVTLATDASVGAEAGTQLTLSGVVGGPGGLTKYGLGELVLNNSNTYLGTTFIDAGFITAETNTALGTFPPSSTLEASTVVAAGAALDLNGQGGSLTLTDPLVLAGTGINDTGALRNVSGINLASGNVTLAASAAIGVDAGTACQLALSGEISEGTTSSGITKVGPNRLILSGFNTYTGPVVVQQGTLNVQNDSALGTTASGTTVDSGAALEIQGGVEVGAEALTLNGSGINNAGALLNVAGDNRYDGNVTFASNVVLGAAPNSRLTMSGDFSDGGNGYSLTKVGGGNLTLAGNNTYSGGTHIEAGIVNIQSNTALGANVAATVVENGAALQMQDGVNVSDQNLVLHGTGPANAESVPLQWFPEGPAAINGVSGGNGDGANASVSSGRITAIAADPSNPNVIYVGAATGGIWKTVDGGQHWIPLTDNLPPMFIGSIAVSPSNPNIIYAGTGEANSESVDFEDFLAPSVFYGEGVLKSTDGGATWTLIGQEHFNRQVISKVVINPTNPNIVYLATGSFSINGAGFPDELPLDPTGTGIWKTTDGGQTWTNTTFGPSGIWLDPLVPSQDQYTDLVMDPLDSNNLYAAIGTEVILPDGTLAFTGDNGLYESLDGGGSWFLLPNFPHDQGGFLTGGTPSHIISTIKLAIAPVAPDFPLIYGTVTNIGADWSVRNFEVDDVGGGITGGAGWTDVKGNAPNWLGGQGFYDNAIGVNPSNELTVFVGGVSEPGFGGVLEGTFDPVAVNMTWTDIGVGTDGNGPHTDHHALVFNSLGQLLDGNDGGIWLLANPTTTAPRWVDLNADLQITQFYSVTVDPADPSLSYGGTQDNGTMEHSGSSAQWEEVFGGDGGTTIIDPNNPQIIYGNVNSTLIRSEDGGNTWTVIENGITPGPTTFPFLPLAMDPSNSDRLVTGTDQVYETTDQGNDWTALSQPDTNGWTTTATVELVALANNDPNVIYADAGGDIFVTFNHGQTWNKRDIVVNGVTINDHFGQILVDPNNPLIAYVVRNRFDGPGVGGGPDVSGHVFRTVDGGQTWFDITGDLPDLPTWSIAIDPRFNPNILYVGTDEGVYASTDLGQNWTPFGTGLPQGQVRTIILDTFHDVLTVGTFGRGMFQLALDSAKGSAGAARGITGNNTWSGNITLAANTTVGADIDSTVTLSGILSDGGNGSSLTKLGPGEVILGNTNTYSGPTTVVDGILDVQTSGALGTNSQVTVLGGTLQIDGNALSFFQNLTLNGPGYNNIGALNNISGNNTWTGPITLGSNSSIGTDPSTVLTITGAIGDGGLLYGFDKYGGGELVLTGADTYGGNTTIFAGDINVQNVTGLGSGAGTTTVQSGASLFLEFPDDGNLYAIKGEALTLFGIGIDGLGALRDLSGNDAWNGSVTLLTNSAIGNDDLNAPLTINGLIRDNGSNSGFSKEGDGRLILTNSDTYTGGTVVDTGELNIQNAQALGGNAVGTTVNNGAVLELEVSVAGQPLVLNGNGPAGNGALEDVLGNNTWAGPITLASSSAIGVDLDNQGNPLQLTITGEISGLETSVLEKVGLGTLIFPTANDYFGQTLVSTGILDVRDSQALGALGGDGTFVVGGATLEIEDNITVTGKTLGLTGTGVSGNGALENASGNNTWSGPIILIGDATIGVDNASNTLTANQMISEAFPGSNLTKVGAGTLLLAGSSSNTYTGTTQVDQGTLQLDMSGGAVAFPGNLIIGDSTGAPGTAIAQWLAGNQLGSSSSVTVNSDGLLKLNSQAQTIAGLTIVDGTASTGAAGKLTINGLLSMIGGSLATGGASSLVNLGGNVAGSSDTLTGAATISGGGTLSLDGSTRTFTMTAGTQLNDMVISAVIAGVTPSDGVTVAGTGTLDLVSTPETYQGLTTVTGGTLLVDSSVGNVLVTGGTLGGKGTVGTVLATGGTVMPESPVGTGTTLTSPTVTLNLGSAYGAELNSTGNSLLNVTGALQLNGSVLTGAVSFDPAIGQTFTIIHAAGGITGTLSQVQNGITVNLTNGTTGYVAGLPFTVNYTATTVTLTRLIASTTTSVTSSGSPSVYGQPVTFTATVSPVPPAGGFPAGILTFTIDAGTPDQMIVPVTLVSGQATLTFSQPTPLTVGTHTVLASYGGDPLNFTGSASTTLVQVVNKADTAVAISSPANPSVFGQAVTFTATVNPVAPGSGTPTGTVQFLIDGTAFGSAITLSGGVATSLSISSLAVAGHTVTAVYSGDSNFNGVTDAVTQTVNKDNTTTSTVVSSLNPSTYGQTLTFSTTVTANQPGSGVPTGTVTFLEDGTPIGSGSVTGGTASLTTNANTVLAAGTHAITASYSGDGDFNSSTTATALSQTVNQAGTVVAQVSSSANPSAFGQPITFTTTVTAVAPGFGTPTGTVSFFDNGNLIGTASLSGGTASLATTNALTVGSHSVTASYSGDSNFKASTTANPALTQTVKQAASSVALNTSANPSVFGQPVVFSVTVTAVAPGAGTPSGNVTLSINGLQQTQALNPTGNATFTAISSLPVGTYTATVSYTGDNNFGGSKASLTQIVGQASTSIATVGSSLNPSVYGQAVTFSTTVTANSPGAGTPTGTVTFLDNGTPIGTGKLNPAGQASFTIAASNPLAVGNHTITASYGGDANFTASATATAFAETVNQDTTTTAAVTSSVNPTVFGQATTLATTVTANGPGSGTPTGAVTFLSNGVAIGTATLSNGAASLAVTTGLPAGTDSITAAYSGDNNFSSSTSNAVKQTVNQDASTTSLAASPNPSSYLGAVTFTASVTANLPGSGTPTGSVTFVVDGTAQSPVNLNASGQATLSLSALSIGAHTISVTYSGDSNFLASGPAAVTQIVKDTTTIANVSLSPGSSVFGQAVTFTTSVTANAPGTGTPTGTVTFLVNNVAVGTATLNGGTASFTTTALPTGSQTITASYGGDSNFQPGTTAAGATETVSQDATTTATVTASPGSPVFGQAVTFTVSVTANPPGAGTPTGTVTFLDGAVSLGTATLSGGIASFTTSALLAGNHSIAAAYAGDVNFLASTSATALSETISKDNSTTTLASSLTPSAFGQQVITATVIANPPGAGTPTGSVIFTVDGTPLPAVSLNAAGQAALPGTALGAGTHSITATYEGDLDFNSSAASTTLTQTVNKAATTITLTSSALSSVFSQPVTLTASITPVAPGGGTPTGNVLFTIDGKSTLVAVNAAGQAILTTATLGLGSHSVGVVYQGDPNFTASGTASLTQTVTQDATTTTVTSSANPSVFGQLVTLTAAVQAAAPGTGMPTGTVTFVDGSVTLGTSTLSDGTATLQLPLSVGTHSIVASYSGDADFIGGSTTAPLSQAVNQDNPVVTVTSAREFVIAGRPVVFTATVTAAAPGAGIPTGTVTFVLDGSTALGTVSLTGGTASLTSSYSTAGPHTITVQYSGDANFKGGTSSPLSQTVSTVTAAFLDQVYLDLLHRHIDPTGLAVWTAQLNAGVTRTTVVREIESSLEYQEDQVQALYEEYLHRAADPVGLKAFSTFLATGGTVEQVAADLIGSNEYFQTRGGSTNVGFLNALFHDVLHRAVDPAGEAYFLLLLQEFTPHSAIATQVLTSLEARRDLVDGYFVEFLGRHADSAGLNAFANILMQGGRDEDVIADIMGSDEFLADL